jgi:hypothetical protein
MISQVVGKQFSVEMLEPKSTIIDVKFMIQGWERIPIEEQRLIFGGKQLEDGIWIDFYCVCFRQCD